MNNDVNVPSKSYKQEYFCWHLEGHWQKEQDSYLLVGGTDPRIRKNTKMSRIRNTAFFTTFITKINNNQVSGSGVVLNKNKDKIK
jgi:hypothetical protein